MKTNTRLWYNSLLAGLFTIVLALAGCSGDDGAPGAAGAAGADGADGTSAIILADIVPINPVLDLSNTISYNQVSGAVTIHFFLQDEEGNGIDINTDAYELRIYAAELIDNNDGTAGQSWTRAVWNDEYERGTPAAGSPLPGTLTLVDAATGEYNYVCAHTLPTSPNVQRITVRARWRENIDGTNYTFANSVNTSYDFLQADPATELVSSGADLVLTENCETCHGARIGDVGHGGGYTAVKTCNNCHNINYMGPRNGGEGDLAFMVHRIHSAGDFLQLDHGGPISFAEVTYPQHTNTCAKCHGGAPEGNLSLQIMTNANCSSCHDNVDANVGTNHAAGPQPDSACTTCHTSGIVGTLADIVTAHDDATIQAKIPENVSEFAVNISMTPPANGTHYVAGVDLAPLVTVTLSGAAPVPYNVDQDAEGASGGNLSTANLYVYGPRAAAVPVLTTNSTTDPAWDPLTAPSQGHSLFLTDRTSTPNPDGQVVTDATGYKYQLMNNLADLEPGTYMVRFEGLDYDTPGAPSVPEYVTASSAVINFQVGTADVEHKLAGDACTNCHGATIMHLEGAHPHHQAFNTDGCLGCHDKSGNYGDYIGNRVHAVHSASATGDLKVHDWSHVTFPQEPNNCTICHTDTNADTPVWRNPNEVACGGCHGTDRMADPDNYPDTDPARILAEAAAAEHMWQMGGTFLATDIGDTRQCIVCHGEGRIADLYDTHHLVLFPPPVVPQP